MAKFTIPTVYKAIDQMTAPLKRMWGAHNQFAKSVEGGLARSERLFRKLTPTLSETSKQMFAFARSAAIAAAIVSGVSFSANALMDYETQLRSFNVIVSDSKIPFAEFQKGINAVATDTRKSAVDVAASYEKIAGLNAKFAETSEGIASVTRATIILAKASGMELGPAAESLVGIMNQFSFGAEKATRTINALAAGEAVGASTITQTAEAMVNFGAVAAGANITLEESVGLVQVMAKYGFYAAEAGNKLKGSITRLQKAGMGYASGQFNINDALLEANKRIAKLSTAKAKDAAITKMFGVENLAAGRTLLANIGLFNEFTKGVTGTNLATDAAALRSNTLRTKLDELKNTWVNLLVSNDKANGALESSKRIIGFVTDNLGTIVSVGVKVLGFFLAWKAVMIATRVVLTAYNVALGIHGALTGVVAVSVGRYTAATAAYKAVAWLATSAQWAWNAALTANPIGLVIAAIALLSAAVVASITYWEDWGAALTMAMGPIGGVVATLNMFRLTWDNIVNSFKNGGIVEGIKAIGKTIVNSMLYPVLQLMKLAAQFTGQDKMAKLIGFTMDKMMEPSVKSQNPKAAEIDAVKRLETVEKQNVKIDINDKTGRAKMKTDNNLVPIKMSSTVAAF